MKTNKIIKNITLGIVCLFGVGAAVAVGTASFVSNNSGYEVAHAEPEQAPVSYIARSWDGTKVVESEQVCTEYTEITGKVTALSSGWYVVKKDINAYNDTRITCTGTVNLILSDNVVFRMTEGISTTGATLNIYGQENDSGLLHISNCDDSCAAIGGAKDNSGGTFNFHGGSLWAHGGFYAAGIGSGQNTTSNNIRSGEVTIYGGTVYTETYSYGAGIGGGEKKGSGNITIDPVKIYGGNVTAFGSYDCSGIGAGKGYTNNGELTVASGLNVLKLDYNQPPEIMTNYATTRYERMRICAPISYVSRSWDDTNKVVVESTVNCISYTNASAFQEQYMSNDTYVVDSNFSSTFKYITIYNNCNLILFDGCSWAPKKGIYVNGSSGSSGTLNIYGQSNGTGTLFAGDGKQNLDSAGIGGHSSLDTGKINIFGGRVKAIGGSYSAGIGGVFYGSRTYTSGEITIYGGDVTAIGGTDNLYGRAAAGIGSGAASPGYESATPNVTIYGGNVNAIGGEYGGAGIGGGYTDGYLLSGPAGGDCGTVNILGGTVRASGGKGAKGIGTGRIGSNQGTLTVGSTLDVYGEDHKNPGVLIEKGSSGYERSQYMVIKGHEGKIDPVCTEPTYVGGAADQVLNTIPLPDGWTWKNPTAVVGDGVGAEMSFIPSNTDVYNTLEKTVNITVNEPVSYIDKEWNSTSKKVDKTTKTCSTYRTVSEDMETTWPTGWYLVNSDVTISDRIIVDGTVNLILGDGCTLTANDGISIAYGDTINIYSQSDGDNAGKLIANVEGQYIRYSPLGGPDNDHSGTINIYGGDITSTIIDSSNNYGAAAIGGGYSANSGPITIYGGKVQANGTDYSAGIGGAYNGGYSGPRYVDDITIYDGTVIATGGSYGSGIGSGYVYSYNPSLNLKSSVEINAIRIYGGNITANGGSNAGKNPSHNGGAGIGAGAVYCASSTNYNSATIKEITINGGTVNANGGNSAAGIGGGYTRGLVTISNITINGGTVNATAYHYYSTSSTNLKGGAGIGSGFGNVSSSNIGRTNISNITINGGKVTASGYDSPGIGLADYGDGSTLGTITINRGTVITSVSYAADEPTTTYDAIGCATGSSQKGTIVIDENMEVLGGSTENPTDVITDYNTNRYQFMTVKSSHVHDFTYSLTGPDTIYASCTPTCYLSDEERTLTLVLNDTENYYAYDGTAKTIAVASGYSEEAFENIDIKYYQGETEVTTGCIDLGTYEARVTVGGKTASKSFTITKADVVLTAPTAKSDLEYTGSAQELVNGGTATGGTIQYRLEDGEYSTDIPTGLNNGTYNVYYKVIGDANHNDIPETGPIQVTIAKANVDLTAPTAVTIAHDGNSHELVTPGSVTGGELQYKLGADGEYSTTVPTASEIGTYDIYYRVIGDANHNDVPETGPLHSTINESVATITSGEVTTYYYDFATALSNWGENTTLTLLKNVTISTAIVVNDNSNKVLNLNGFTLSGTPTPGSNQTIVYVNGGKLTINGKDVSGNMGTLCKGTGHLTDQSRGGAIAIYAGGEVTINDCNIRDNECAFGGAIYVSTGTTATLNNCNVYDNITNNSWGYRGVIYVEGVSAKVYINGGEIYNNSAGVYLFDGNVSPYAKLNGVYIHDNIQYGVGVERNDNGNPALTIAGDTIIKNNSTATTSGARTNLRINNSNDVKIAIDSELGLGDNASIGITLTGDSKGIFTDGWSTYMAGKDPADYFVSDNPDYIIYMRNGEAYCGNEPIVTISNGTTVDKYDNIADAVSAWTDGTTLTLLKDITTSGTINVNNNVTLDLNGYGIKATGTDYSVLTINDGGKLTIIDSGDTTQYFTVVDRYAGNGAGFATVCDKATYDAADENLRGTFQGGYITGGNIESATFYEHKAGAITVMAGGELDFKAGTIIGNSGGTESPGGVSSHGTFTLNGGNIIYNRGRRGSGVFLNGGAFVMNSGSIEYNTGVGAGEYGTAALHSYGDTESISLKGGSISHNYTKYGGIATPINIFLSGDFVAVDNIACGPSGTEATNANIRLTEGALISGCITGNTPIGITLGSGSGVFTNNTDTSLNDPSKFVSDNPNYAIGVYPAGHANAGQLFIGNKVTVTYNNNGHGDAPTEQIIANGGLIFDSPTPTVEGYDFKGWYKEAECETAWDFDNDVPSSDITLYAKWDYDEATTNVIKLINDIGTLAYDGGSNDSLDDILAAATAYDALSVARKDIVDGVNKDVLDHDMIVYKHVDKVGDLIKGIPTPNASDEYYDAVDFAKAEYDKLTDEEKEVLDTDYNFDYLKAIENHRKAIEVIKVIDEIGDVTYNGGDDDSKDDIENAEEVYNSLTEDQKKLVDLANHDELQQSRDTYDKVDDTVKKIDSIGDITHGGEDDSKEDINKAREIYDSLTPEQKALVDGYKDSYVTLDDAEHVYDVLEKIDAIGEVGFDTASEKAIEEAKKYYSSLTPEQQAKVKENKKIILAQAEQAYDEKKQTANILLIILIIIASLLLLSGIIVLIILIKKRNKKEDDNNDNNKKTPVKVASFAGLTPMIFMSHYLDTPFILLYIISGLALLAWIAVIIVAIFYKRHKKQQALEEAPQQNKQVEAVQSSEDEEEVVTITDEKGNIFNIRYIKSFTAKLIQSSDETKAYYEELKNYVLSYKKTNSRVSWHYDSVNSGRNQVLKFAIRGKTLCIYLPLNPNDYADSKYKVETVDSKKYEEVPCLYRIKNDRRRDYAKDLIDVVMTNLGLVKGEEQHNSYYLHYEENKPLIIRGLIKELKVQVNKPVIRETQILSVVTNEEGEEVITKQDSKGNIFQIRYIKSFTAKLIQANDESKHYYEELKNYVLSYKKTTSRISWNYDSINSGRNPVLKFVIRGKTLCVYFPLNPDDYADTKYKVEKVESKKFEEVPCLYRIKNDRRCEYAKDLIDTVMANLGLVKGEEQHESYVLPYEENKPLIARGLIKELEVQVNKPVVRETQVLKVVTNEDGDEVITKQDSKGNIFQIRYIKSFTAKLSQSDDEVKDYYNELKNYALSYKKANSRISWHYDSINVGRNQVLKFSIRGKTLCLYYALDANSYADSKYKVEVVESKKYEDVPCLYRIKNDRRRDYAKELIDVVMNNVPTELGKQSDEDFRIPYEETNALLAKGLIKELKVKIDSPEPVHNVVSAHEVDEKMSDEIAESKIEEDTTSKKHVGKKGIINIDTIGDNFNDGDVVDIETLWKKKLVSSNVGYVKVLARGSLNKRLTVNLQDYSLQAVKMVLLAGGKVKKAK